MALYIVEAMSVLLDSRVEYIANQLSELSSLRSYGTFIL